MDKINYLCRYHNLIEKMEKKKEYIAFCNERAGSIPGPSYGERINNPSTIRQMGIPRNRR